MKYLIMCEGPNEKAVVNLLLDNNLLIFNRNDLLGLDIYHARQLVPYLVNLINSYNCSNLKIIRIGDKFTDKLKIPESIKHIIDYKQILKCHTHPELEILLIIDKNLFDKFNKEKSKIKAKDFAKKHISLNGHLYDNTTQFWNDYFKNNIKNLVNDIKKCKKIGKNKKEEIYLADLLKK